MKHALHSATADAMKLSVTIDRDADGAWVIECPALPGCVRLGNTKTAAVKNFQAVISECLTVMERGSVRATRRRKHRFASEVLIGSLATGLKTGDNATVRRLARQRLREKNR